MNNLLIKIALPVLGGVLSLLMGGNLFFISRLVNQLDNTSEIVRQLRQDVVVLKLTVDNIGHRKFSGGNE